MKKHLKDKGITLIALVVTIIILLILAGVTIGVATNGTGLFEKAKLATDEYNNKAQQEEIEIAKFSNEIDNYVDGNRELSLEDIQTIKNMLYPNKSLEINAFTDTTTEQTYTIPRDGWLYIRAGRQSAGWITQFYRNNMEILAVSGVPNSSSSANSHETCYLPVKQGDIIKKVQSATNFFYYICLYYYEAE